ncbi:hypothetical protein A2U01_0032403, partial [Trifolium medium]|nr:hypothetical protein [Trifolium medium]
MLVEVSFHGDVWAEASSRLYASKLYSCICAFPVLAGSSHDDGDPSLD